MIQKPDGVVSGETMSARAGDAPAASPGRAGRSLFLSGKPPMPKMRRKADLPTRICTVCKRPFAWRRKWARDWQSVKFCSERCRGDGRRAARQEG
ncbi:DUF2256 domain-containing protein [Bradyrhizobium manausense]|uniref:DUF2256 domain-containing protein n=1 Tax=Bradyrhizobium manausense TaxID=989370 RepID=UPI0039083781